MTTPTRIAVVEDEADLRDVVVDYLRLQGFAPIPCPEAAALDAALAEAPIDLVLLDLNLPKEGGLSIARRLKALAEPPGIIMVTALGESVDRVVGLEIGADDYVGKPFELRELLARIRSLLRRRAASAPVATAPVAIPVTPTPCPRLSFAGFTLWPGERRLIDARGAEVPLTAMEFDLLLLFASHAGEIFSREALLARAHGKGADPLDRSIDIRITRLRRKLEATPDAPPLIRTVRGRGYVFEAPR